MYSLSYPQVPQKDYQTCKAEHTAKGRLNKFIAHQKIGRFLRNVLYLRQHGICPICKRSLLSSEDSGNCIHHNDYEAYCTNVNNSTTLVKEYYPTKRGYIYRFSPNCELCYFDHPERSEACLSHLSLVHNYCHGLLHGKELPKS